jgi:hypothetical protein
MRPNKPDDLWRYVDVGDKQDCWTFTGLLFDNGYGRFNMNQTSYGAHRIAYELTHGAIPNDQLVMHKCNNKACCNPRHLTVGTGSENQRHASMSGVWPPGASGIRGIGFDKKRNYWTAQAFLHGKRLNLYTGPHKQKAIDARKAWESEYGITFEVSK